MLENQKKQILTKPKLNPVDLKTPPSVDKVTKPKPVKRVVTPNSQVSEYNPEVKISTENSVSECANYFFQAIGVISGIVEFNDTGKAIVIIENKEFPLQFIPGYKKAFFALRRKVKSVQQIERLIVYPRITHFPEREKKHELSFQLVGFEGTKSNEIAKELQDFEFKLSGMWQFIPVCQTPCISVFRNFTDERLAHMKQIEAISRVRFMRASHLPLLWNRPPVRPFRFNCKLSKEEQGHATFVKIIAKFIPEREMFGFSKLVSVSSDRPPRFLKVRKEDKAEALRSKTSDPKRRV